MRARVFFFHKVDYVYEHVHGGGTDWVSVVKKGDTKCFVVKEQWRKLVALLPSTHRINSRASIVAPALPDVCFAVVIAEPTFFLAEQSLCQVCVIVSDAFLLSLQTQLPAQLSA